MTARPEDRSRSLARLTAARACSLAGVAPRTPYGAFLPPSPAQYARAWALWFRWGRTPQAPYGPRGGFRCGR